MISVCMASYNGERYISEQIETILQNLGEEDELVISDDGSTDATRQIISALMISDRRIRLFDGPRRGVNANFSNAIRKSKGDYIFLSDQDDIWMPDKVAEVMKVFENSSCAAVVHDASVVDHTMQVLIPSFFAHRHSGSGWFKNLIKNSYMGCCMAFRSSLKEYILPVPENIECYDQWIGMMADLHGGSFFLSKQLMSYRRHGENTSSMDHYPIKKMIRNRIVLTYRMLKRILRGRKSL